MTKIDSKKSAESFNKLYKELHHFNDRLNDIKDTVDKLNKIEKTHGDYFSKHAFKINKNEDNITDVQDSIMGIHNKIDILENEIKDINTKLEKMDSEDKVQEKVDELLTRRIYRNETKTDTINNEIEKNKSSIARLQEDYNRMCNTTQNIISTQVFDKITKDKSMALLNSDKISTC